MRREGRPHGMVRTYTVIPPPSLQPWTPPVKPKPLGRITNKIDTPPTAGIFTKVPNKPTNHSKFTGKCEKVQCNDCHVLPVCKSKVKSKSTNKVRSSVAEVNYQLNTWKMMGDSGSSSSRLRSCGYSASGILNDLDSDYRSSFFDDDDHGDVDNEYGVDQTVKESYNDNNYDYNDDVIIHVGVTGDGDDGYVGFYDVGYVMNSVDEGDEEGWAIVGEDQILL